MAERRVFDPFRIFGELVAGRVVVYLDHNIWIDLRDARTAALEKCVQQCRELVAVGDLVFPVSYAAVSELLHVPDRADLLRQAALMDDLSAGTTFRMPARIYEIEARCGYQMVMHQRRCSAARNSMFSVVPEYLGDGHVAFPPEWNESNASKFMEMLRGAPVRWTPWFGPRVGKVKEEPAGLSDWVFSLRYSTLDRAARGLGAGTAMRVDPLLP